MEPDEGISDAFNKGINAATGNYIGILNADDCYDPQVVAKIADFATQQHMPDVIYGSIRHVDEKFSYEEHPDLEVIWDYMSVYHPAIFVRQDIYAKIFMVNLTPESLAEVAELIDVALYYTTFAPFDEDLDAFRFDTRALPMLEAADLDRLLRGPVSACFAANNSRKGAQAMKCPSS